MYVIDVGFNDYIAFKTMKEAQKFCNEVAKETSEILSIIYVSKEDFKKHFYKDY